MFKSPLKVVYPVNIDADSVSLILLPEVLGWINRIEGVIFLVSVVEKRPYLRFGISEGDDSIKFAKQRASELGLPVVRLQSLDIDPYLVSLFNRDLLREHRALPLFVRGSQLFVAVTDPSDALAISESLYEIRPIIAAERELNEAIKKVTNLVPFEDRIKQTYSVLQEYISRCMDAGVTAPPPPQPWLANSRSVGKSRKRTRETDFHVPAVSITITFILCVFSVRHGAAIFNLNEHKK